MSNPTTLETSPSKKRGGPARLVRSALLACGCRSDGKPSPTVDWGCGLGLWNVVSSVRPLHHPPEPPESVIDIEGHHDGAEEETCTVSDVMSSYGSAQDLSKLDCSEEEVEVEEEEKSIDQRAEEFIAHFYEQMRLQQLELESVED